MIMWFRDSFNLRHIKLDFCNRLWQSHFPRNASIVDFYSILSNSSAVMFTHSIMSGPSKLCEFCALFTADYVEELNA
jgi:hypothetical protein